MSSQPEHSLEIERKYDVDDGVVLPNWRALPGVVGVDAPEPRELDARYFDTADLALARGGAAVRRREGGPDAGWHIKVSAVDGKHEYHWPLTVDAAARDSVDSVDSGDGGDGGDGGGGGVPVAVAAAVADRSAGPFVPIARIRNHRVAYGLRDVAGGLVAEVVDDHVTARNERSGGEQSWREWEVELGPAGPATPAQIAAFFTEVDALVAAAGGRVSASPSKLARALSA